MPFDKDLSCYCNKKVDIISNLSKNILIARCPITKIQISDLKVCNKVGTVITYLEKEGTPCNFIKKIPLQFKKNTNKEAPTEIIKREVLKAPPPLRTPFQLKLDHLFSKIEEPVIALVRPEEDIGTCTENSWPIYEPLPPPKMVIREQIDPDVISNLDSYAINNLLIKPWDRKNETFPEYIKRFKETPWINQNWKIRHHKYKLKVLFKKNYHEAQYKCLDIFDDMPILKETIQKTIRKRIKKQDKEAKIQKKEVDDILNIEDVLPNDTDDDETQAEDGRSEEEEEASEEYEEEEDYGLDGEGPEYGEDLDD